jgi:hypothetical protein
MESTFIKSANIIPFTGTEEEYHANHEFISASALKKLKVSPAHFKEEEEVKETDALLFGSAYHCFILEPSRFEKEYYIFDDETATKAIIAKANADGKDIVKPRATKEYKEWLTGQEQVSAGKIMIDKADFDKLVAMRSRLMAHPYAKMLLNNGVNEQGYMGDIDTEAGRISVKIKPDHVNENKKIIVDLKTCMDASADGFTRHAADLNYHIQAAFYSDIMEKIAGDNRAYKFFFIAQEKKSPYAFNIFESSPQFISQGRFEYEMLLQLYKYCLDNNTWPGYQIWCENKYGILELKLPSWAIKDLTYYDHIDRRIPVLTN